MNTAEEPTEKQKWPEALFSKVREGVNEKLLVSSHFKPIGGVLFRGEVCMRHLVHDRVLSGHAHGI